MDCEYAQGFVLSHPVPAGRFAQACRDAERVVAMAGGLDAPAVIARTGP
jgi:hypothetical protein